MNKSEPERAIPLMALLDSQLPSSQVDSQNPELQSYRANPLLGEARSN